MYTCQSAGERKQAWQPNTGSTGTAMSEDPRIDAIRQLSRQLRRIENRRAPNANKLVSTGISALDHLLPCGGIERGTIIEWLAKSAGSGAGTLVFTIAAWHMQPVGTLVVIDPRRQFYPPAAARLGVDLERTIVVCPNNTRDTLWSLEQSLLCPGVAVSACHLEDLDDRVFRRLQLATETGGGLGLLLRSARFHEQPSWADVRLLVEGVRNEESGMRSQESGARSQEPGVKRKKKKTKKQQPSARGSHLAWSSPHGYPSTSGLLRRMRPTGGIATTKRNLVCLDHSVRQSTDHRLL